MRDSGSWLDRAKRLLNYRREAAEFIERVSQQLPVSPSDAASVSLLWEEADELDAMVCSLLNEMNAGLMAGRAELDTTRGAVPAGADGVTYECSWTLAWNDGLGLSVKLSTDPRSSTLTLLVRSTRSAEERRVPHPTTEDDFKLALAQAYAAEASIGDYD